jgi:hypothetical protein
MLVIQLFWHSEHAYTTHLNYLQTERKKIQAIGDWFIRYMHKKDRNKIKFEYEAYIGIEYMFIVHGCKIGPEYVPI